MVTTAMNEELLRPFCAEEIKAAIMAIHPDKAPGPDVLNPEGFSILLQKSVSTGELHGCKITQGALEITHILFSNDSFLFFWIDKWECQVVKDCLRVYKEDLGQQVNLHKSSLFFSRNTHLEVQNRVHQLLNVTTDFDCGNYLGLPSLIVQKRKEIFMFIKDRVWKKTQSWSQKCLSRTGKKVLIKSVAQVGIHDVSFSHHYYFM